MKFIPALLLSLTISCAAQVAVQLRETAGDLAALDVSLQGALHAQRVAVLQGAEYKALKAKDALAALKLYEAKMADLRAAELELLRARQLARTAEGAILTSSTPDRDSTALRAVQDAQVSAVKLLVLMETAHVVVAPTVAARLRRGCLPGVAICVEVSNGR